MQLSEKVLIQIRQFLSSERFKGWRQTSKGFFALELEWNNINPHGVRILRECFTRPSQVNSYFDSLQLSCTLRILNLDNNLIGSIGAALIGSFLGDCICLIVLSLCNNSI